MAELAKVKKFLSSKVEELDSRVSEIDSLLSAKAAKMFYFVHNDEVNRMLDKTGHRCVIAIFPSTQRLLEWLRDAVEPKTGVSFNSVTEETAQKEMPQFRTLRT